MLEYGIQTLQLTRIMAISYEENVGSVRVIEKLGFQFVERISDEGGGLTGYWHPAPIRPHLTFQGRQDDEEGPGLR